jgi:hypothetical protein
MRWYKILWHVDPLVGNDREKKSNYKQALLSNGSANKHVSMIEYSNNWRDVLLTYVINNINMNPVQIPIKCSIHHFFPLCFPHFETRTAHDQISGADSHLFLSTVHMNQTAVHLVHSALSTKQPGEYLDKFPWSKIFACRSDDDYSPGTRTTHAHSPIHRIHKSYWTYLRKSTSSWK